MNRVLALVIALITAAVPMHAIAEEIADVEIMMCQLRLMYGIKTTDMDALIAGKINRLKERMEEKACH